MKNYILTLIFTVTLNLFFCTAYAAHPSPYKVGAIRWDAWYGGDKSNPQDVGNAVETTLQDKRWRYRTPTFMVENPDGTITLNGATQEIMDEEILLASKAGLAFWAYCIYDEDVGLSKALTLHRSSKIKDKMPFCIITGANFTKQKNNDYFLRLIQESNYFKVNGRPVIFSLCIYTNPFDKETLDKQKYLEGKKKFFAQVKEKLGVEPILIIQDSNPEVRQKFGAEYFNADYVSAYWALEWVNKGKYSRIIEWGQKYWERLKSTGYKVIPIVTTGCDPRPRYAHPVPWDRNRKPDPDNQRYYENATPEEIGEFLQNAIDFVKDNPKVCPDKLILMYAWNEYDEGGWLAPTFGDGTTRLEEIKKVLDRNKK